MTRRELLLGTAASAMTGLLPRGLFAATTADFDENLAVLLADVHVNGLDTFPGDATYHKAGQPVKTCMRERFSSTVAEILRMNPLPRNVIIFGDLAYIKGRLEDYRRSYPELKMLTDVGIRLTIGMGNHDHRKEFLEVWPEYEKRTLVPGAIHTVTPFPCFDLVMLDTLQDAGKIETLNPVSGKLGRESMDWIQDQLPKWPRPFILGAHHSVREIGLDLRGFPNCRGYIHGHDHIWKKDITTYQDNRGLPLLTLPSNGCWGDIGYAVLRIEERNESTVATASLVQHDFFLRQPVLPKDRKMAWEVRVTDNYGEKCSFAISSHARS